MYRATAPTEAKPRSSTRYVVPWVSFTLTLVICCLPKQSTGERRSALSGNGDGVQIGCEDSAVRSSARPEVPPASNAPPRRLDEAKLNSIDLLATIDPLGLDAHVRRCGMEPRTNAENDSDEVLRALPGTAALLASAGARAEQVPTTLPPPNRSGAGAAAVPDEVPVPVLLETELPPPERLFRVESEYALDQRLRQQVGPTSPLPPDFPKEEPVPTTPIVSRGGPHPHLVEPNFVAYRPLLFVQPNSDRYGWGFGYLDPFLQTGIYWYDMARLPFALATFPFQPPGTGAGRCLPGDPVPYIVRTPLALFVFGQPHRQRPGIFDTAQDEGSTAP